MLDALAVNTQQPRENRLVLLEHLQNKVLEVILRKPQQELATRLAVVGGLSEEQMWTNLMRALSRYSPSSFNSLANKILVELEASGGKAAPGATILARCRALRGLQFPTTHRAAPNILEVLTRLEPLLTQKQFHPKLREAVCCNLGTALGNKGDLDGAIASWKQALSLEPEHVQARTNLGIVLRRKAGGGS